MKTFEEAKQHIHAIVEEKRLVVVVDDSQAIHIKTAKLSPTTGYDDIKTTSDGKGAGKLITKLIKGSQNPIVLLDMELPEFLS